MKSGRSIQPRVRSGNRRIYHLHATRTQLQDRLQFIRRQWWIYNARVPHEQIIPESVPRWILEKHPRVDENTECVYHSREWERTVMHRESCARLNICLLACVNSLDNQKKKLDEFDMFLLLVDTLREDYDAILNPFPE